MSIKVNQKFRSLESGDGSWELGVGSWEFKKYKYKKPKHYCLSLSTLKFDLFLEVYSTVTDFARLRG